MPRIDTRPAIADDAEAIVAMVRELAAFEGEPEANVKLTAADLVRDAFGPAPRIEIVIAELDGETAGFALFFHNYSTWEGRAGLYVEDLFVREAARGHGVGRHLLTAIAEMALARGCVRVDLSVLEWNPARRFYERLGLTRMADWLPYRMNREAIERLAGEADPAAAAPRGDFRLARRPPRR